LAGVFLLLAPAAIASEPVGVFAMIEKVVFEPTEKSPERVQVWGAFQFVQLNQSGSPGRISMPKYGYLYFKLPDTNPQAAKIEWTDLKAVAGTGQAVGFGNFWLSSDFSSLDAPRSNPVFVVYPPGRNFNERIQIDMRVRPASEAPANP